MNENLDRLTVGGFGREWAAYDQTGLPDEEARRRFDEHFAPFVFDKDAVGFDLGCGSGRWAKLVAPRVKHLTCIDPSDRALAVARSNVTDKNVDFIASADVPLKDQDFGYCLGVIHHIPDPQRALNAAVAALRPGGQFLVYVYYRLENRPIWFKALWKGTDLARRVICRLPFPLKLAVTNLIATFVYWPLARLSRFFGPNFPLSWYGDKSFYSMRTDALDRFGTRLEHRFTKDELVAMMRKAGLESIRVWGPPNWCALGIKS